MTLSAQTIDVMSQALNVAAADITNDTGLGQTPAWDSLAHMRLILLIEDRTGRVLAPEEIINLTSVAEVETLLASAG